MIFEYDCDEIYDLLTIRFCWSIRYQRLMEYFWIMLPYCMVKTYFARHVNIVQCVLFLFLFTLDTDSRRHHFTCWKRTERKTYERSKENVMEKNK